MKEYTKTIQVYVAEDGKEFTSAEDCQKYETGWLKEKKNIKYFRLYHSPDLTETGCFCKITYVAVYYTGSYHKEILEHFVVKELGIPIIGCSVQGYGLQTHFRISDSTEKEFIESKKDRKLSTGVYDGGQVFLSTKPFDGFPEPFDYIKNWNIE